VPDLGWRTIVESLSTIEEALDSGAIRTISAAIGESSHNTHVAMRAAVPTILSGMLSQATEGGSDLSSIAALLTSGRIDSSRLGNVGSMLQGSAAPGFMEIGHNIVRSIFGDKLWGIQNLIASQSGVHPTSALTIMGLAGTLIMAAIGKLLGGYPTGGAVANLLNSERSSILSALPAGLDTVLSPCDTSPTGMPAVRRNNGGITPRWVALGLLALGLLGYFLYRGGSKIAVDSPREKIGDAPDSVNTTLGDFLKRQLPDGVVLNIPKLGMENRLIAFMEDSSIPANKIIWFDFDRLRFETGRSTLQPSSQDQLVNIAAILKAYPKAHVTIAGHTANAGDKAMNLTLSAERANTVMNQLVALGADPAQMSAEGYGEEHPVADNSNEEGRANNRRIYLRVTEK
jgi:outer membrane protein OmpA-like peptidoglycan-associated protein